MYQSKDLFHPPKVRFKGGKELGEKWELRVCDLLSQYGYPSAVPTSTHDPELDRKKVDITILPSSWVKLPFHIQCKSSAGGLSNHHQLISQMPTDKPPIIFHQQTVEVREGDFQEVGMYAILKLEDFLYLTQQESF